MEKASASMSRMVYFEAERMALKALLMARQVEDFERMARIVLPLQEARRQRLQLALDAGELRLPDEPYVEGVRIDPGCYLIQPPQVGADARRFRLAALQADVPVAVVCREPRTRLGEWPIVAVGPGLTIRTRIKPPDDPERPDAAWFVGAMEAIGDAAIESVDLNYEPAKRVDLLIERLGAVPDHEKLHQALEQACREAAAGKVAPAKSASRSASASGTDLGS